MPLIIAYLAPCAAGWVLTKNKIKIVKSSELFAIPFYRRITVSPIIPVCRNFRQTTSSFNSPSTSAFQSNQNNIILFDSFLKSIFGETIKYNANTLDCAKTKNELLWIAYLKFFMNRGSLIKRAVEVFAQTDVMVYANVVVKCDDKMIRFWFDIFCMVNLFIK